MTIPGAEKVIELGLKKVTIFATQQTVHSRTYRERVGILDETVEIEEIALPGILVPEIESLLPVRRCHSETDFQSLCTLYDGEEWNCISPEWSQITHKYFAGYHPEHAIVFGCTHYPYLGKSLKKLFPPCQFIDPSLESALALERYIKKHEVILEKGRKILFL